MTGCHKLAAPPKSPVDRQRTPNNYVGILRFRGLGFRGLGFRGLGFRGLGFRDLGV